MDPESCPSGTRHFRLKSYKAALCLAYQSLGVVYGDLSTSPIYVYKSTFSGRLRLHEDDDEILGVLSLIFWTLTLIPLCKYIIFVLGADDNGEGGTFALYSLLCRSTKTGFFSTSHASPDNDSIYYSKSSHKETNSSAFLKELFEKHRCSQILLLFVALLGTSMVIGDGVLTPSMSVLSAVYGIQTKFPNLHEDFSVLIACAILVGLFALQHYGTHRVGFLFAPVVIAWLMCISSIGIYNILHWNPSVVGAVSPYYVYNFFRKAGKDGWSSLGGIVLCITGAEAMFADLGHFSKLSIRIAFTVVVYPCLILAYMGEAAYLCKHKMDLQRSFYKSVPEVMFWPVFIIATLATIVGSQAIISATFSIISQCRALRCFPRVKVMHTSNQIHGQIYIPEVNWMLMVLCLAVVIGFRDTNMIGNAYGVAVITVMFVTTCMMFLIIVMVWKRTVIAALVFVFIFGSMELLYFSACLSKVHRGGWVPLVLSFLVLFLMSVWHYGTSKKHSFELRNKVDIDMLLDLGLNLGINRVAGIGLVYSSVVSGVPPMFSHFVTNFPAFHQVLIFVTIQSLVVPRVPDGEQFTISRIGPREFCLFRCIVRYGYRDARKDSYAFETHLIRAVAEFLQRHGDDQADGDAVHGREMILIPPSYSHSGDSVDDPGTSSRQKKVRFRCLGARKEEAEEFEEAKEAGMAYMMGNPCVMATDTSPYLKKFIINIVYGFLRQNCRRPTTTLAVPHTSLIEVGMVYQV